MIDKAYFNRAQELIQESLGGFAPELVLSLMVIILLLHDLFTRGARPERTAAIATGGFIVTGLLLWMQGADYAGGGVLAGSNEIFGWITDAAADGDNHRGMLAIDGFAWFFKAFVLLGTLVTIPMCLAHPGFQRRRMGEFYALLTAATLGMFLMASATNLLMVYMGIEFASMASYLAVAFIKRDRKGSEAGLKYVVYGSVASGIMIYGLSMIYGMTGSLHIDDLQSFTVTTAQGPALAIAGVLSFAGFAYKMAAFPMHFWCPDVYEGSPVPFTAYLSVTSKAAGFAVFIRFMMAFGDMQIGEGETAFSLDFGWQALVGGAAALSMTAGNMAALWQTNVKRMLAYSSIAHAGYLLMGLAAFGTADEVGVAGVTEQYEALLFYMVIYFFMNLGAFYVVTLVGAKTGSEELDGYKGLIRRSPFLTVCLGLCLVSLLGIPPAAGFMAKLGIFKLVIDRDMVWLAVVAGINTAISAYYYIRLLKAACLDSAEDEAPLHVKGSAVVLLGLLSAPVLIFFVLPEPLSEFTRQFGL